MILNDNFWLHKSLNVWLKKGCKTFSTFLALFKIDQNKIPNKNYLNWVYLKKTEKAESWIFAA